MVSYNHYFGWYGGDRFMNGLWFDQFHEICPNIPMSCSEYGCETLNRHTSDPTAAPEVADPDLEFTAAGSLAGFVASGGAVSLGQGARDGALVYTLNGAGTSLQSPTITAPVGDAYCARLDIKNTIFFRLKNDTDAAQLRVYFKTPAVNRYTAEPDTSTPTEPAESETSAPDTDNPADPTPDSETDPDTEKPKGGCGSVTVSCAAILCAVAGAVTLKKKKER